MQLVPLQPVPPASVPLLPELLTHQLIPLPGDGGLKGRTGEDMVLRQVDGVIHVSSNYTACSSPTQFQMQSLIRYFFSGSLGQMVFVGGE